MIRGSWKFYAGRLFTVRVRNQKRGSFWYRAAVARRDDGWQQEHTARTRRSDDEGGGKPARQGEKPPRRATTRRRAMHSTIVINGGNIVAASHLTAGRRRQVPLRQRGELNPRLRRTLSTFDLSRVIRPVAASCCACKTCPIWSHTGFILWTFYIAEFADIYTKNLVAY